MKNRQFIFLIIFFQIFSIALRAQIEQQKLDFSQPQILQSFSGQRTSHQSVISNHFLYVLGGYKWANNTGTVYRDVQYTSVSTVVNGGNVQWITATNLNTARSGLGVVAYNGFLYAIGGCDENWNYLNTIEIAKTKNDGSIESWQISQNTLNSPRSNLSAGIYVANGGQAYLYAIGGVGLVDGETVHFPSIEYAPINNDGTIGKWKDAAFQMKGGRSQPSALIFNNRLFIIGGWGDILFEDVFSDVQFSDLNPNGSLKPWHKSPYDLRMRSYSHSTVIVESSSQRFLLAIAGSLGEGNNIDFIQYSALDAKNELSPWIMANGRINGRRWGQSAVYDSGNIIITGGADGNNFLDDLQVIKVKLKMPTP